MAEWFAYLPADTIFIRGAEPMLRGESHGASTVFPPPPSTIEGALRTAVLAEKGVHPLDYNGGRAPQEVYDCIGKPGSESPFSVWGPLFMKDGKLVIPCPYTWNIAKEAKVGGNTKKPGDPVAVVQAKRLKNTLCIGKNTEYWVKGSVMEMKSAGGNWIYAESLNSNSASCRLIPPADLYRSEIRTGIALDGRKRTAREGYLYSLTHVRLNPGVKLVFGVDRKLPLPDRGILRLGGEQRFGGLERISALEIREGSSGLYMSLALIEGRADNGDAVVASGRPVYIGGWDMSAGFHKPMRGYYPAGTVFSRKLHDGMIQI